MTISIQILSQKTIEPSPFPPPFGSIHVDIAIRDDADTNLWYKLGLDLPYNTADVPAALTANDAGYYADAKAAGVVMTQDAVNNAVYQWLHYEYREIFNTASQMLGNANFNNGNLAAGTPVNPTLQQTRDDLTAIQTYLDTELGGTPFRRSYLNERFIAQVHTPALGSKTAAECAQFMLWLRCWIGDRIDNANKAEKAILQL